ncbi:MAG TPA: ABC transporter ATP-binding protein [Epulopiscium sp.]|nr:ABC transporter ATP-binding protein [Candidatus Epulonipiscium sp.]
MDNILEIKELTKKYKKNKSILTNLDLEIKKGKIVGLLGPNGSGKTTLIKSIVGLVKPDSGEILIDGHHPGIYTKSIVSYLPDLDYLPKWMKIKDAIEFFEDFYQDFDKGKSKRLLKLMKLEENQKIRECSKGMNEKLQLALVLSRNAQLYILDEPIAGVDPVAREKILDAIVEFYSEDSAMIITTQLVTDMERVFDDVIFIKEGNIILYQEAEQLRIEKNQSIDELYREVFAEC